MKDTPSGLFPVAYYMTGTTPNGGGLWKYVLHKLPQGLLRRNIPTLTQVLHFLEFSVSPQNLAARWRKPLRESYNGNFGLNYQAPIFFDSGGFTLMFDPDLDLAKYGIPKEHLAEGILQLQIDLGAAYVASLDYPIPPGLDHDEAERRLGLTSENAIKVARKLAELPDGNRPELFVPIHGPTPERMRTFVADLFEQFSAEGLTSIIGGLAIGSMVPLRRNNRSHEIISYVRQARSEMPSGMPLHVFGVTGTLVPFLMMEGATSFDTSAYVQNAKVFKYIEHESRRKLRFTQMDHYDCTCAVCSTRDYGDDMALLEGRREGQRSEIYAAIALHNLELDFGLLDRAKEAQAESRLDTFVEDLASQYKEAGKFLNALRGTQPHLTIGVSKSPIISHDPSDFDVSVKDYRPQPTKRLCLILPCSQEKPYTSSRSFSAIWRHIQAKFDTQLIEKLEIVFLSGLYGPVPLEYVQDEAVTTYDFLLHPKDEGGIHRGAERLSRFLEQHRQDFDDVLAYVTQSAYRKVITSATSASLPVKLLPSRGRKDRLAFYKAENVEELMIYIEHCLKPDLSKDSSNVECTNSSVFESTLVVPSQLTLLSSE